MKRREFFEKTKCGAACLVAAPFIVDSGSAQEQEERKLYKIDIEIFEAREDSWCHKKGDTFAYPQDIGKVCPWLVGSMRDFIVALEHGAYLHWKYEGTPYEKVINPDNVTTEFVRCPDPTADLVAKITRTRVT